MPRKIDPVDELVGRNIRVYRTAKGFSQTRLAESIGITFQQVQKYEKGANRVASGKLAQISRVLHVPLEVFFRGAKSAVADGSSPHNDISRLLVTPHALRMLRAFSQIQENELRLRVVALAESIARQGLVPSKRSRPLSNSLSDAIDPASRRR